MQASKLPVLPLWKCAHNRLYWVAVRLQDSEVNEIVDRCHCSRFETVALVKQSASEYSAMAARVSDFDRESNGNSGQRRSWASSRSRYGTGHPSIVLYSFSLDKVAQVTSVLGSVVLAPGGSTARPVLWPASALAPVSAEVAGHACMSVVAPVVAGSMDSAVFEL